MLAELTDHIMDIAMNSVRAGSRNIAISVIAQEESNLLKITISDDGIGMSEDVVRVATDPFFSTKEGRKVGLGISLLKGATEMCGGDFSIESAPGKGTTVCATFALDHPDLPPLGDMKEAILLLCVSSPEVRFEFRYAVGEEEFHLDTNEILEVLEGVPINHPQVIGFLERYLDESLR
jgi:anti-sigma regulatory factor (Ser/Thr protein kinase)